VDESVRKQLSYINCVEIRICLHHESKTQRLLASIINIVLFGFPSIVKRIIQGKLKEIIEKRSFNVQKYHPEIESEK